MKKIILSMITSIVGIAFFIGSQNTNATAYRSLDNANYFTMLLGVALQFAAAILFMIGAKQYFLGDIIKALTEKK